MINQFQENSLMLFVQSPGQIKQDFFGEVLGFNDQYNFFQRMQENISDKRLQFDLNMVDGVKNQSQIKCEQDLKLDSTRQGIELKRCKNISEKKDVQTGLKAQMESLKNQNIYFQKNYEKTRRTTRCTSKIESENIQFLKQQKSQDQVVADFSPISNQTGTFQSKSAFRKALKLMKKASKFIFKEKEFGKTFKISFPKKVVQMFINHYEQYPIQNQSIRLYNDSLKQKLKQNKKNDYTFQKQVSQILGENVQNSHEMQEDLIKETSHVNRKAFSQIIRETMKQQVIMRDKIAKNRQLYMIQLKVYALRCRSHKLAKKGTFK